MALADDIALIMRVPLFSDLSGDHLRLLAFSAVRLQLPAGQVLFRAGAKASSAFVIMSGEIEFSRESDGKTAVLGRYGTGALLGETALFTETLRPATATAVGDAEVLEIDGALIRRMLSEYPELAVKLYTKLRERFGWTLAELGAVGAKLEILRYPGSN